MTRATATRPAGVGCLVHDLLTVVGADLEQLLLAEALAEGGGGEDMSFAEAFSALTNYVPSDGSGPDDVMMSAMMTTAHMQQHHAYHHQDFQQHLYYNQVFNNSYLANSAINSSSSNIAITEAFHELSGSDGGSGSSGAGSGGTTNGSSYSDFFYPPSSHTTTASTLFVEGDDSRRQEVAAVKRDSGSGPLEAANSLHTSYMDKGAAVVV